MNALMEYDWPGNIRELENTIERAVVLSKGREIASENLMYHGIDVKSPFWNSIGDKIKTLEEIEKEYIKSVLQAQNRPKSMMAEALGIDRKTLWAKIKKYNLE